MPLWCLTDWQVSAIVATREAPSEETEMTDTKPCSTCGTDTDELALFPGGICVNCYAQTPAANAPLTADGIKGMWSGRNLLRK